MTLQVTPLAGFPMVGPGDDLAALILDALARTRLRLETDDVVVVTGKVVSKAEDRLVELATIVPSPRAEKLAVETDKDARLVELVLRESTNGGATWRTALQVGSITDPWSARMALAGNTAAVTAAIGGAATVLACLR